MDLSTAVLCLFTVFIISALLMGESLSDDQYERMSEVTEDDEINLEMFSRYQKFMILLSTASFIAFLVSGSVLAIQTIYTLITGVN